MFDRIKRFINYLNRRIENNYINSLEIGNKEYQGEIIKVKLSDLDMSKDYELNLSNSPTNNKNYKFIISKDIKRD